MARIYFQALQRRVAPGFEENGWALHTFKPYKQITLVPIGGSPDIGIGKTPIGIVNALKQLALRD